MIPAGLRYNQMNLKRDWVFPNAKDWNRTSLTDLEEISWPWCERAMYPESRTTLRWHGKSENLSLKFCQPLEWTWNKCSRLIFVCSQPSPHISYFSKEPRFLLIENSIHNLRCRCWMCLLLLNLVRWKQALRIWCELSYRPKSHSLGWMGAFKELWICPTHSGDRYR